MAIRVVSVARRVAGRIGHRQLVAVAVVGGAGGVAQRIGLAQSVATAVIGKSSDAPERLCDRQHVPVGVRHDSRCFGGSFFRPFVSAGRALPVVGVAEHIFHRAGGASRFCHE